MTFKNKQKKQTHLKITNKLKRIKRKNRCSFDVAKKDDDDDEKEDIFLFHS